MVWLGFFFREVACGLINVFTNSLVAIQKAHLYFPPRYPAEACSGARCSDGLGGAGCFGLFFFPLKHELRPVVATRVCASLRPSEAGGALGTPGRAAAWGPAAGGKGRGPALSRAAPDGGGGFRGWRGQGALEPPGEMGEPRGAAARAAAVLLGAGACYCLWRLAAGGRRGQPSGEGRGGRAGAPLPACGPSGPRPGLRCAGGRGAGPRGCGGARGRLTGPRRAAARAPGARLRAAARLRPRRRTCSP